MQGNNLTVKKIYFSTEKKLHVKLFFFKKRKKLCSDCKMNRWKIMYHNIGKQHKPDFTVKFWQPQLPVLYRKDSGDFFYSVVECGSNLFWRADQMRSRWFITYIHRTYTSSFVFFNFSWIIQASKDGIKNIAYLLRNSITN